MRKETIMYFLIEITTTDKIAKAVYQYDTLDDAVANFHSKMGSQMKSAACQHELVVVMDEHGAVYKSEEYTKPVATE